MLDKEYYANGQKIYEISDDQLTYFYKNGNVRAKGLYVENKMEGEWKFYRETGQFWQTGNFENNEKHGLWIRYNRKDEIEYQEHFIHGKIVKKNKQN